MGRDKNSNVKDEILLCFTDHCGLFKIMCSRKSEKLQYYIVTIKSLG